MRGPRLQGVRLAGLPAGMREQDAHRRRVATRSWGLHRNPQLPCCVLTEPRSCMWNGRPGKTASPPTHGVATWHALES
jgi:hypothetical protein